MQTDFQMKALIKQPGYTADVMAGRPPINEATEFGKRVAAARQQRGLTQRELAEAIGVSLQMIEYYERRAQNVKTDVIIKLSQTLQVSSDELLGLKTPKAKTGRKSRLRQRLEEVEQLPRTKQQTILQVLDMAIKSA